MIEDLDIYRAAKLLIDKHGGNAGIEASMRADALLEQGDPDGNAVWMRSRTPGASPSINSIPPRSKGIASPAGSSGFHRGPPKRGCAYYSVASAVQDPSVPRQQP